MARDAALEEERLLEEEAAAAAAAEETRKKEQNSSSTESQSKESLVVNLGKHNDLSNDTLHYNKECDGTILQEKKYGTTVCMDCGALGSQGEATAKDFDFDYEDIDLDYPK
jgi:hypothetical protein